MLFINTAIIKLHEKWLRGINNMLKYILTIPVEGLGSIWGFSVEKFNYISSSAFFFFKFIYFWLCWVFMLHVGFL